jgi:hypothetical protein
LESRIIEPMATIHITEAEAARDLPALLAKLRANRA